MFWFILIILIIALIAYRFITAINEDNNEFKTLILSDRFKLLVDKLNEKAFDSEADIHIRDKRSFCLHLKGGNQLVEFFYSTGHLNIQWKLKFPLEDEVIYEKQINNVRNLEADLQIAMADEILDEVEVFFRRNCPNSIKYYYEYNKFGFLYKETALNDVKTLFIKEVLKNETDDFEDINLESSADEDDFNYQINKKDIFYESNGQLINVNAYKILLEIKPFIDILRASFTEDNNLEVTKDGKILLYRDDLKETIEFVKRNNSDIELKWKYNSRIHGEQYYNIVLDDLITKIKDDPYSLFALVMDLNISSEQALNKSLTDDFYF